MYSSVPRKSKIIQHLNTTLPAVIRVFGYSGYYYYDYYDNKPCHILLKVCCLNLNNNNIIYYAYSLINSIFFTFICSMMFI